MARTFWLKKKNGLSFLMKASNGVFFGGLCMLVRPRRGDNGNKSGECMFEKVSGKATKLRVDRPIN